MRPLQRLIAFTVRRAGAQDRTQDQIGFQAIRQCGHDLLRAFYRLYTLIIAPQHFGQLHLQVDAIGLLPKQLTQISDRFRVQFARRVHARQRATREGNYFADPETLDRLEGEGRVAFRYVGGAPNGAARDIAGVSGGPDRNVVGLMPHPERACESILGSADGLAIFESVMQWFRSARGRTGREALAGR